MKAKILGFYKRERDGNEYVLFEVNRKKILTNGIFLWNNEVERKYLPQLEKIEMIDKEKMIKRLNKTQPYNQIFRELLRQEKCGSDETKKNHI